MPPKKLVWPIESHTHGKHIVLRAYLNAWLPIMGITNQRIVFIDGFAGPGEYENGEDGSPIIALKAIEEHQSKSKIKSEVIYVFIEFDQERAHHLKEKVKAFKERLPPNVSVEVVNGDCVSTLNETLDDLERAKANLAPAFVMLDPFGVSHTPLSIVSRFLKNPKCEMYISFMYEAINRFKESPEFEPHLDDLFGTAEWRQAANIADSFQRKQFIYRLYERQLRTAGAKYVTHFELFDGDKNRHVYTIFFATKHTAGMDKMKEAIWRADRTGGYQFRGSRGEQMTMEIDSVNLGAFQSQLLHVFRGREWVRIEEITEWARTDKTDYYSGQVKRALKPMEQAGRIEVDPTSRKRPGTYPDGTRIRFKAQG